MLDLRTWGLSFAVALSLTAAARAEVFHLAGGGEVRGELINPAESPRSIYVVKTAQGGKISLAADQVQKVDKQSTKELEYDRLAVVAPDTVKGQWELAEFCHENHLPAQRKKHLERIIQLDPENVDARHALGYSRIKGEWVTVEEGMDAQGRKRYKGAWRLPQEIELMERAHKEDFAQKEWFSKLKRWRGWFSTGRAPLARAQIADINDPLAVKALSYYLDHEENREIKFLWIDALSRIGGGSLEALVTASLDDSDEEVRIACLERLQAAHYKPAVNRYVQMLKHKDNAMVNLAAVGLLYMNDPAATRPLIDALVTTHKFTLQPAGQPGQMSASFGSGPGGGGGGGFSFGQPPAQEVKREQQNSEVLRALVTITSVNFEYNVPAWKKWYSNQKTPATIDARRDER